MIKPARPRRAAPLSAALLVASAAAIAGCASKPENTIIDPQPDEVAAAQLAIDGEIEQREVPDLACKLEVRPDRPDVFGM